MFNDLWQAESFKIVSIGCGNVAMHPVYDASATVYKYSSVGENPEQGGGIMPETLINKTDSSNTEKNGTAPDQAEADTELVGTRVLAMSLLQQLPSDQARALAVLDYARWFVKDVLHKAA